ncbi:TM2 domain-containing protein [Myxosarcina sp. GI1]|uniref:TM2 domain-containing protein n=1 Tax=Myxosarcina sp. GI1 TaxID=1541065 RepID=UPI0005688F80|nr:TM2 domain-containing protein [Myxosarcina sp. GI1]
MNYRQQKLNTGTAYILWIFCCFGICGIHRFYLGKIVSGLLYLFTFGLFGFGQFIDLFLIPGMTAEKNRFLLQQAKIDDLTNIVNANEAILQGQTKSALAKSDPMLKLLQAAASNNNVLSIGQATIATELPVEEVEKLLQKALKQGLAHIDNDEHTGAVRYYFDI